MELMKSIPQCLAAYAVIVGVACLLSTLAVHASGDAIANTDVDRQVSFAVPGFGLLTHLHYHSHNKEEQRENHYYHSKLKSPKLITRKAQLNLICNSVLIDKVICKTEIHRPFRISESEDGQTSAQASFDALSNGGTGSSISRVFIKMGTPCSNKPSKPVIWPIDEILASDSYRLSDEGALVEGPGNTNIWFKKKHRMHDGHSKSYVHGKHGKHRKYGKHRRRRKDHRHSKHGKHYRHGKQNKHHITNKRPWLGLCAAKGKFCGSNIFGCMFGATALYRCDAVGKKPEILKSDAEICGGSGGNLACKCGGSFWPVCGSQLSAECKADPTAIYHCPGGSGSRYQILKLCMPGTQCRTPPGGYPICGFASCNCKGDNEICSEQFPESCEAKKNSDYKCTAQGKPDFIRSCDGNSACVAVSDGATCTNDSCPFADPNSLHGATMTLQPSITVPTVLGPSLKFSSNAIQTLSAT
ncbi:hypothetical protein BGZ54_008941 [Gamsiella multidivaricata]|nr:hypothetical protein BGZ54_008941 [Gamsiella multidivaricata]